MLTGRLPFEGDSAVSVAIQHLSSVPLSPRDINENVPEALELICMKAMNPNPDRRYASAEAMLEDLEKFRKDPSTNMEYIRAELKEKDDVEPTQPIPADEVASAVRKTRKTDEKPLQENNKMNKKLLFGIIGGFAALLILIFAAFKIFGNFGDSENGTYVVPDIRGYTVEQAENLPGVKGIFTIEVLGSKPSTQYEPGQIMEQDPAKDHTRKNNLTIKVYLCAEEQKYYMPNLIGYDSREAKLLLDNMDIELNVTFKETYDDQVPAGQVISTTPASDSELKKGNNVLVFVSLGKETKPVTVPSFIGMTLENAIAKAQELGLAVGGTTYQTSDVTVGKVIDQSLAVNSTVEEGTAISFTVSKGQETPVDDPTDNPPVVPPDNPGDSGEDPSVPQGGEGTSDNAH